MRTILAALALAVAVLLPAPAYAVNGCTVTPDPVVWTPEATYTVTAQLQPHGWYSIRIDVRSRDHFGHHAESAPLQLDGSGWLSAVFSVANGPRDSVFPGDEATVHIRPADGTGGGGARCEFTVVAS